MVPVQLPSDLGFFTKNGPHALRVRGIFSKFFYPEKLAIYTPNITKIVDFALDDLICSFASIKSEFPPGYPTSGKFINST